VKNVKRQSLTRQIRDFQDIARDRKIDFILKTNRNTKFTKPLQRAIDNGDIIHEVIGRRKIFGRF